MHVSCAGRTTLPTFAFTLRASRAGASIEADAAHDALLHGYAQALVDWDAGGGYLLLRPRAEHGYLKLLADGSYSFRHYTSHGAVMSIGRCQ